MTLTQINGASPHRIQHDPGIMGMSCQTNPVCRQLLWPFSTVRMFPRTWSVQDVGPKFSVGGIFFKKAISDDWNWMLVSGLTLLK